MTNLRSIKPLVAAAALAACLTPSAPAEACGGCFVQTTENTQVTSHRMVMSISMEETTLWDQIVYDGNPEEFAWVLPIRGEVEVGLSSDALFNQLDSRTSVTIQSPVVPCGGNGGNFASAEDSEKGAEGPPPEGSEVEDPVEVLSHEVVGPFETVQLQSTDPEALNQWLLDHGYDIPEDIQPIVIAYVEEGFNFLALRLLPGEGTDAMRPVRVTSQGASTTLPLRMVAAGTGATTPITLWVLAEGRYQPANMEFFQIGVEDVVWDWDASASNYTTLRQDGFDAADGGSWLVESAYGVVDRFLDDLAANAIYSPESSGYGDADGQGAAVEAAEDHEKLVGKLDRDSLWVTRLYGELARPKLSQDLQLEAAQQVEVRRTLVAERTTGTAPVCPTTGTGGTGTGGTGGDTGLGPSSCALGQGGDDRDSTLWLLGVGLFIAAGAASRRRARRG